MEKSGCYDLSGKVAVLTGGAGALCSAMARALGDNGAKVAILDVAEEAAMKLATEMKSQDIECLAVRTNVLDIAELRKAAAKVMNAFGRVDILGPADDHVLLPVYDIEKPFFILPHQIGGVKPSSPHGLSGGLRILVVLLHYGRSTVNCFTDLSHWDIFIFIVYHSYLDKGEGFTHRCLSPFIFARHKT